LALYLNTLINILNKKVIIIIIYNNNNNNKSLILINIKKLKVIELIKEAFKCLRANIIIKRG
jgi:hypothetical protein